MPHHPFRNGKRLDKKQRESQAGDKIQFFVDSTVVRRARDDSKQVYSGNNTFNGPPIYSTLCVACLGTLSHTWYSGRTPP